MRRMRPLLGTFVEINLSGPVPSSRLQACASAGFRAIERIDRLMSFHRSDSDLGRLNQAPIGAWVEIDPRTARVLRACNELWRASGGAFDPRVGRAGRTVPVELRGGCARRAGPALDLGGIAKGFAVDAAVRRMSRWRGVRGVVNAGGDLRVWGGRPVPVALRARDGFREIRISDGAVATSSVGARSDVAHRRMPSGRRLRARRTVSVFAARCGVADPLTKILLAAPPSIAERCLVRYGAFAFVAETGT